MIWLIQIKHFCKESTGVFIVGSFFKNSNSTKKQGFAFIFSHISSKTTADAYLDDKTSEKTQENDNYKSQE